MARKKMYSRKRNSKKRNSKKKRKVPRVQSGGSDVSALEMQLHEMTEKHNRLARLYDDLRVVVEYACKPEYMDIKSCHRPFEGVAHGIIAYNYAMGEDEPMPPRESGIHWEIHLRELVDKVQALTEPARRRLETIIHGDGGDSQNGLLYRDCKYSCSKAMLNLLNNNEYTASPEILMTDEPNKARIACLHYPIDAIWLHEGFKIMDIEAAASGGAGVDGRLKH